MLTLYTANGTGSFPTDPTNYPSLVALALLPSGEQIFADKLDGTATTQLVDWVPTDYPMATYPMGASVNTGVQVLGNNIAASPVGTPKALLGYSQGGIVTSTILRDHVLNGELSAYKNDFVAGVTWGNPMRAPNVCNGNDYAQWGHQTGGGISGANDLLPSQTPSWWFDFANPNDLYTDSPVTISADGSTIVMNDAAKDEELIYNMVVSENFGGTLEGLLQLVVSAVEQFLTPLKFIIGLATSIWNGLTFVAAGPNAGHYTYDPTPAIDYLASVAAQHI
jgi:PE-PPE domain